MFFFNINSILKFRKSLKTSEVIYSNNDNLNKLINCDIEENPFKEETTSYNENIHENKKN